MIIDFFDAVSQLHDEDDLVLAYHDRSDGGLLTTIAEMAFAGRCGVAFSLDSIAKRDDEVLATLFNEELGAVFQIREKDEKRFKSCFATSGPPPGLIKKIGYVRPTAKQSVLIEYHSVPLVDLNRGQIQQWWSRTSFEMQQLRDNSSCARMEFDAILDDKDPGLSYNLDFDFSSEVSLPLLGSLRALVAPRPRVAILREQGVNGHAGKASFEVGSPSKLSLAFPPVH
jgi:phosphoribosylformylglycinamidine synthase